jgi:hypothetical protein
MKKQRIEVASDFPKPGNVSVRVHYMGMIGLASFDGQVTKKEMKRAIVMVKEQIRETHNRKKATH